MSAIEFWVMRVVIRAPKNCAIVWRPSDMTEDQWQVVLAKVRRNEYVCLPTGDIVEPVECFDAQAKATEHALALAQQHDGKETFLIVLNADPEAVAGDPRMVHE